MDMNQTCKRRDFLVGAGGFAFLSLIGSAQAGQRNPSQPARRVVTGVNSTGQSVIAVDGPVPDGARISKPGEFSGCDLWAEKSVPVNLHDQGDPMADYSMKAWPGPGEVIVRTATWEPGFSYPMHRSVTIDFVFIISGQVELILEGGSTVLRPGDCVVQRGTNHAWQVVGSQPCTIAAVLLSAETQGESS